MTDTLTIAIAAAIFGVLVFLDVLRANRNLPFFPRAGEGEQQGAAHGDAKLDGTALPAGMIDQFHTGSNRTQEQRNHG
jgi:hypothetical protein